MVADFNPWVLTPHCSLEVGITIVPFWTMKREWRWEGTHVTFEPHRTLLLLLLTLERSVPTPAFVEPEDGQARG